MVRYTSTQKMARSSTSRISVFILFYFIKFLALGRSVAAPVIRTSYCDAVTKRTQTTISDCLSEINITFCVTISSVMPWADLMNPATTTQRLHTGAIQQGMGFDEIRKT